MAKKTSRIRQSPGGPQFAAALPVPVVASEAPDTIYSVESAPFFYRWNSDGTSPEEGVRAPDDSFFPSQDGLFVCGGTSDGVYQYVLTEALDANFYIDRLGHYFDSVDTRFATGWSNGNHTTYSRCKHVASCATRLVYFAWQEANFLNVDVAVCAPVSAGTTFDATVENTWSLVDVGSNDSLSTGSVVDPTGQYLFFNVLAGGSVSTIVRVDLTTGSWTYLPITEDSIAVGAPTGWPEMVTLNLAAVIDGDPVLVGENRNAVRVTQDGTNVWWLDQSAAGGSYYGGVRVTDGDLWFTISGDLAFGYAADRVTADGVFVSTLDLPSGIDAPYYAWSVPFLATVWGGDAADAFYEWIAADGSAVAPLVTFPADDDAYFIGDGGGAFQTCYAGGSDGTYNYLLAIDASEQWWVDKFNIEMTELVDRWEITGWDSVHYAAGDAPTKWVEATAQIVSACATRVVVIADTVDQTDPDGNYYQSIDVSVFDTAGTLLNQWSYDTSIPLDEFGTQRYIYNESGSFTDGEFVWFWINDETLDPASDNFLGSMYSLMQVNLADGTFTLLLNTFDLNVLIDANFSTSISAGGIVVIPGGDFIAAGESLARFTPAGVPVWAYYDRPFFLGDSNWNGLALSGNGSVWAWNSPDFFVPERVDEWGFDGTYRQSVIPPENVRQAWLVQPVSVPPTVLIGQSTVLDQRVQLTTVTGTSIITS